MSEAPRSRAWWFPTLAEQVADGQEVEPPPGGGLFVVLDGLAAEDVLGEIPTSSAVVSAAALGSLGELCDAVARRDGDVLLVSDGQHLSAELVAVLAGALASDSACATVSFDPGAHWIAGGLPPPAIDAPRAGLVLVRRDHLLLALDDAELLSAHEVGLIEIPTGQGLIADALACLLRPGFVHRGCQGPAPILQSRTVAHRRGGMAFDADVVLDGRGLAFPLSGSQAQLIGLLGGLVRAGARVALLAPATLHDTTAAAIEELRECVPLLERSQLGRPPIFHRPFQIGSLSGLVDCLSIGDRLVVTQQDMIASRTAAYAPSLASWDRFRAATAAVLSAADEITFFTRHAALDAASDGAMDLERATVIPLGVDHFFDLTPPEAPAAPLGGRAYLLVLGNAYWHKNRVFALRLTRWLIEQHGWEGGLVLAGGHPDPGSSRPAEEAFVDASPALHGRVVDVGHVPDEDRLALYAGADLVLFATLQEGFGFIPFEAAALGRACAYTHRASLRELLPAAGALPSFDLEEAGAFVLRLLEDESERRRIVRAVADASVGLTWDRTATGYLEVYARALERPRRFTDRERMDLRARDRRPAGRGAFDLVRTGVRALRRIVTADRSGAREAIASRVARSGNGEDRFEERPG